MHLLGNSSHRATNAPEKMVLKLVTKRVELVEREREVVDRTGDLKA